MVITNLEFSFSLFRIWRAKSKFYNYAINVIEIINRGTLSTTNMALAYFVFDSYIFI